MTTLDDYRWLVGASGRDWLERLAAVEEPLIRVTTWLRRELSATKTHLLLEQATLRQRAKRKFTAADQMFFTDIGLQQATDQRVATYKAHRFPAEQSLADLCCGIGGDLLALAGRGPTAGVDRDAVSALLAEANLAASYPRAARSRLLTADATSLDVAEFAAWHLDPDRRSHGRRTTRVADHEPNETQISRLLAANPQGAVKLAPAAPIPAAWSQQAECEWISRGGECRQVVAWFGDLAEALGQCRATVLSGSLEDNDARPRRLTGPPNKTIPAAASVRRFVYEPDSAVLAAHLVGALAAEHGLEELTPRSGYLTGDSAVRDAALAGFEVFDAMAFDVRRLKAYLRRRRLGRLEVKKRCLPRDLEALRRQLRVPGDEAATLLIAQVGGTAMAIVARRT